MRANEFTMRGTAANYADAANLLNAPGDVALVERDGRRRQIVIACPDGCGEKLSINLDPRGGPAWRVYQRRGQWSIFPSVAKISGCRSHFILWSGQIVWCNHDESSDGFEGTSALADRVIAVLRTKHQVSFITVAEELGEIPWDILGACRHLVDSGLAAEGSGTSRGVFWLTP